MDLTSDMQNPDCSKRSILKKGHPGFILVDVLIPWYLEKLKQSNQNLMLIEILLFFTLENVSIEMVPYKNNSKT